MVTPQVTLRQYDRPMRILLLAGAMLAILAGLIWIAQGLNLPFAPRSFMTADRAWIVIGALTVLAGAVLVGRTKGAPD